MDSAIIRARMAKKNVEAPLGKRVQTTYPIQKPPKSKFVRVHPEPAYRVSLIRTYKDEDTDTIYYVVPDLDLPEEIADQTKITDLYAAQAHDGTFFIWFVNHSDTSWYRSANAAVRSCKCEWRRVVARKSANIYDLYKPEYTIDEPDWSGLPSFPEMLENGFEDRRITSVDHPVVRKLRGFNDGDEYRLWEFASVWVADIEFRSMSGEPNEPVCLCALELHSGRRVELFFDRIHENPFQYEGALFVGYNAAAEWKTFISLGWKLPHNILDLHLEYLNQINGVWQGNMLLKNLGSSLVDAMRGFGLDFISYLEKQEEREYILSRSSYPPEGQRQILDYCWTDVNGTALLLGNMLPDIDLDQALLRLHVRFSYERVNRRREGRRLARPPNFSQLLADRPKRIDRVPENTRRHRHQRMSMRRLLRLTKGFSKKLDNRAYAVALHSTITTSSAFIRRSSSSRRWKPVCRSCLEPRGNRGSSKLRHY
jgi:hypothetical protein